MIPTQSLQSLRTESCYRLVPDGRLFPVARGNGSERVASREHVGVRVPDHSLGARDRYGTCRRRQRGLGPAAVGRCAWGAYGGAEIVRAGDVDWVLAERDLGCAPPAGVSDEGFHQSDVLSQARADRHWYGAVRQDEPAYVR